MCIRQNDIDFAANATAKHPDAVAELTLGSLRPVAEATDVAAAVVYKRVGTPDAPPAAPEKLPPNVVDDVLTRGEVTTLDAAQSASLGSLIAACTTPGLPGSWLGHTVQAGSVLVASTEGRLTGQAVSVTEVGSQRRAEHRYTTHDHLPLQDWFAGPLGERIPAAVLVVEHELLATGTHDPRTRLDLAKLAQDFDVAVAITTTEDPS